MQECFAFEMFPWFAYIDSKIDNTNLQQGWIDRQIMKIDGWNYGAKNAWFVLQIIDSDRTTLLNKCQNHACFSSKIF